MKKALRILAAVFLIAFGLGTMAMILKTNNAGKRDFIAYWSAGQQLRHGGDPYDRAAVLGLERGAGFTEAKPLIMRNPPDALFLALPLGYVGANVGSLLWMAALIGSLAASVRMLWTMNGRPNDRLHLLGYCFAPVMLCLMAGQVGLFLLLGMTLFYYFYRSRPFVAGAAMLLCAIKPHLFVCFGVVLLVWALQRKTYRLLTGVLTSVGVSCLLAYAVDAQAWAQYVRMIHGSDIMTEIVPTWSEMFRHMVNAGAVWLQFVPEAVGVGWALWYFWTRRERWDWLDNGMVLLLASVLCSPYAMVSDEAVLVPAMLFACYRADRMGRSLAPFGIAAMLAMIEVFAHISMTTLLYLWTVPAWLAWYLYATRRVRDVPVEMAAASVGA